jgi:hypothetical protein
VGTGLIPREVEERQLAQTGVFQGLDPVLPPAAGTLTGVQERAAPAGELDRNAVILCPSISSSVGCAPGCKGSARRNRIVLLVVDLTIMCTLPTGTAQETEKCTFWPFR